MMWMCFGSLWRSKTVNVDALAREKMDWRNSDLKSPQNRQFLKSLPKEFAEFYRIIESLDRVVDRPDYDQLETLLGRISAKSIKAASLKSDNKFENVVDESLSDSVDCDLSPVVEKKVKKPVKKENKAKAKPGSKKATTRRTVDSEVKTVAPAPRRSARLKK